VLTGLHSGVKRNPELRGFVQDMLINHFNQFYVSDTDTLPPVSFTKAIVLKDISAELQVCVINSTCINN
jgi:hypothetical protein